MVGIAQLVRVPGCGPGGRGFEPHYSPQFLFLAGTLGCSQAVRHQTLTLVFVGSNPATPAKAVRHIFDPLAQSVEHLTFNQGVRSSNLRRVTTSSDGLLDVRNRACGHGGIGRRVGFRFRCRKAYEFKSLCPHHSSLPDRKQV